MSIIVSASNYDFLAYLMHTGQKNFANKKLSGHKTEL